VIQTIGGGGPFDVFKGGKQMPIDVVTPAVQGRFRVRGVLSK
jgi:hypothetical protein